MPLKPDFLPAALHSRRTSELTFAFAQSVARGACGSSSDSDARRWPSCGTMMAIGCVASAVACTHMFDTRLHDLYVASSRSSAMYSPPCSFTRFLMLKKKKRSAKNHVIARPTPYRSTIDSVPSLFHRPISPVRSHPSFVNMLSSLLRSSRL